MSEEEKLRRAINALKGIASCATVCYCCEMHAGIAVKVLQELEEIPIPGVRCIECED